MKAKTHLDELKKDKYVSDMLQEDKEEEEEDDSGVSKFSSTSIDKYQLRFGYKDFNVDLVFPVYHKPLLDKNLDLSFQTLVNAAVNLFLISTDTVFREKYKAFLMKDFDKLLKLDKK